MFGKFQRNLSKGYFKFTIAALVIYTMFLIYPMVNAFYLSMTNWNGTSKVVNFVGFENFIKMFSYDKLTQGIGNTIKVVIFSVVLQNVLALIFALILDANLKTKNILRTLLFIPIVLSPLVTSYMWSYMYNYDFGVINKLLEFVRLSALKHDWLGDVHTSIYAVAWVNVWKSFGLQMVIFLAALQNIPPDVVESSVIDGAGWFQRILRIKLPLLAPAFTINIIQTTIISLRTFETVFIMTQGGPANSTQTIATVMYNEAFSYSRMGMATAIGLLLFLFTLIVTIFQTIFLRKREVEL
jgi:ABC-type sugar transport system permease subunit